MKLPMVLLAMLLLPMAAGCEDTADAEAEGAPAGLPGQTVTIDLADRPFRLHIPVGYDPAESAPLLVLLHGYNSSSAVQESRFRFTAEADRRGFLYAMPDGTAEADGDRFWNATPACCDFAGSGVDDVGYLRSLIETVTAAYAVDTSRVWLFGHSNGGFMAHRMGCEASDVVTAVVSLAGAQAGNAAECAPEHSVNVLQIHGTADEAIGFDGGTARGHRYPSAGDTVATWRDLNGCADDTTGQSGLDLDAAIPDAETTVTAYTGCRDDTRVELWVIDDGDHLPRMTEDFTPAVVDFLYDTRSR